MKDGPMIATIAALIGDPARANMLADLMDGRALTAGELARSAGITPQTASSHLSKLLQAGLLSGVKQGRHRYLRLSGPDVAQALESLMGLAQRTGATRTRTGPRDEALRQSRICYDHLAGESGIALLEGLRKKGYLSQDETPTITSKGKRYFQGLGLDLEAMMRGRRPLCRPCLDWSERQFHLGGALGAGLLTLFIQRRWISHGPQRLLHLTKSGHTQLADLLARPHSR